MTRIAALYATTQQLAASAARAFVWLPPLLARLTVGWIFFWSGWGKLHNLEQVTYYFEDLGLPAAGFQAALASTTELVCGALLLAGLLTRCAAVPLIVVMLVALRTALWDQITSLGALFGLAEYLYIALLAGLATYGGGALSLDALLERAGDQRLATARRRAEATAILRST